MRTIYYLKISLVFFFVFFTGKSTSYAQDLCPGEKIINGTFNADLSNWTITPTSGGNNPWYYYNDGGNGTMYASGGSIASSSSFDICKNFTVSFRFKTWRPISNSKVYVWLGDDLLVTLHSKGTKDYVYPQNPTDYTVQTFVDNAEVSESYGYGYWYSVTLKVNNYTGVLLTNLKFEYKYMSGGFLSKGFYIDDVSVKNNQPDKPIPEETQLAYCMGELADLTSVEPDPIPAGISYEWHTVASNPTNATKIANTSAVTAGTYYLYARSNCATSCISVPATVTVIEDQLPNNTKNGFKGGNFCFGETTKLTYNADNTGFITPHTIVYKRIGTADTYTQVINTAGASQFEPGDTPTASGTHKYELIKITDGNGCVRTSGFGKKNAQIKIKVRLVCYGKCYNSRSK